MVHASIEFLIDQTIVDSGSWDLLLELCSKLIGTSMEYLYRYLFWIT